MPTVDVSLSSGVFKNVDKTELVDQSFELVNGYIDELGATRKFPGLSLAVDIGSGQPVDGLYYWPHKNYTLAISGGSLYKIEYSLNIYISTLIGTVGVYSGTPITFTTDGTYVYMANGGKMYYTDGATVQAIADTDAPTTVSHVAYLDNTILANEVGTQRFYYSDVASGLSWPGELAQAVGDGDNLVAMVVQNRELFLFGDISTEIWENVGNANAPFQRIPGGFIQTGCIAPYSIVIFENSLLWLDDKRRFVEYDGRRVRRVATAYDKEVQGYSTVSDCIGMRIEIHGQPFALWVFPTENKTLLYNLNLAYNYDSRALNNKAAELGSWSEIGDWDSLQNKFSGFRCHTHTLDLATGKNLMGDKDTGKIYILDPDVYTYNGDDIRLYRKTGHLNFGTSKTKRSNEMRLRVKAGYQDIGREAKIVFGYLDNNKIKRNSREIILGDIGEVDLIKRIFRTGIYRTRQYEVTITDPIDTLYMNIEEDIDVLR